MQYFFRVHIDHGNPLAQASLFLNLSEGRNLQTIGFDQDHHQVSPFYQWGQLDEIGP